MFKDNYQYQHDYVRLATDTGFAFTKLKPDVLDKNKISLVDVDRIVEERDFATLERLIPCITQFVLDPEQVKVLDAAFVKTFCLSQLTIQYMLFCKKYLDNTVVILKAELKKLKEENQELELFVQELKQHVNSLMNEINERPVFKCDICNKVFSSDEFLKSHKNRRHSQAAEGVETEKLHLEIKELKGRLNSAEKMFQKDQASEREQEAESKKYEELLGRFEDLRLHVQSELRLLQTHHNFEEKYEKLIEKLMSQRSKFDDRGGAGDLGRRRESTTQTELENKDITDYNIAEKQIAEIGDVIQSKVADSLEKIETQMQTFWEKLTDADKHQNLPKKELEVGKSLGNDVEIQNLSKMPMEVQANLPVVKKSTGKEVQDLTNKREDVQNSPESRMALKLPKPRVKPRFKYLKPVKGDSPREKPQELSLNRSQIKVVEAEVYAKGPEVETSQPEALDLTNDSSLSEAENHSLSEQEPVNKTFSIDEKLLKQIKAKMERNIKARLQELGVSPDWRGLPTSSFERVLEIVNHKANLLKKKYRQFDLISTQIEKNLNEQLTPRPKNGSKKPSLASRVEIKNRKLYETESESELVPAQSEKYNELYSAVITELKSVATKVDDSEKSEAVGNEETNKGVLKNCGSVGSLAKKKVLFNLEHEKERLSPKGGSTTSATSSVFDHTPRKDIEDLSDFDFSDM